MDDGSVSMWVNRITQCQIPTPYSESNITTKWLTKILILPNQITSHTLIHTFIEWTDLERERGKGGVILYFIFYIFSNLELHIF